MRVLTPYPGHRRQDREKRVVLQELLDLAVDLAPPVPDRLDVVGDGGDDGLGHEGAGHGDGLLADRLEHVVDDAAGAKPLDLAQSFTSSIPARFTPMGPPYRSSSASRRVARDSLALERAFERGVGLQQQAPQAVDVAGGFVGEVLVVAGEQLQGGEGLVIRARVPERLGSLSAAHAITCASLRSVFASPGSSCAVLRMAVPGR